MVNAALLISFTPKTSVDLTAPELLAFRFLYQIIFSDVALNIYEENLKFIVPCTHFNLYFK